MASSPSDLLAELNKFSAEDLASDAQSRKRAAELSKKLTATLSDPVNSAIELVFSPFVVVAARIAIDLNLFNIIEEHKEGISTDKLAQESGGQSLLVFRLLRLLASVGFINEKDENLWAPAPLTHAMAIPTVAAGHRMVLDLIVSSAIKGPEFLRVNGHVSPSDPKNGFMQYAHHTNRDVFGFMITKPEILKDFDLFMGNTMGNRGYWYDWFPVKERLLDDLDPSNTLLVDVGGGKGHDLASFRSIFPESGSLVLQELAQVLERIGSDDLHPSIKRMQHDFFTEQPIKGARAYFLHHILHDWSDQHCLGILKHLRDAMKPGYSKLLIHELILPDVGATAQQCIFDMTMMAFNSAMERSRSQWTALLSEAGFDIVEFCVNDEDSDGLVEAVVRV
ncbi:hypothetical protein NW762_014333 [Fusarium torreyae]|uniref:O-methyltransferase domain-containing protein n=1 Tax=Fusarium torreyae TaxID=1237075 RepID=A0A9W8RMY1_9HYPO|nr:hypothetical protein NW762_014333 [Fusarium torreyae]